MDFVLKKWRAHDRSSTLPIDKEPEKLIDAFQKREAFEMRSKCVLS